MKPRVAVVNSKSFGRFAQAINRLKARCSVEQIEVPKGITGKELAEKLEGYRFIVASVTPYYGKEFFKHSKDLVMIVRHGIGLDNIDLKAAEEYGVKVAAVPGYREREAVAEYAIALMLAALRYVTLANETVRAQRWHERAMFIGRDMSDLTAGIIGFGNIGSRVAEILRKGFGTKVIAYDPRVKEEEMRIFSVIPCVNIEELLEKSDIVTIHASLNSNYHLINRERLLKAKKGIIIVNTARGELIDQEALIEAIEKGIVRFAALDVVEKEPIEPNNPLLKYSNVLITPHIAAYTQEALSAMDEAVVDAILNDMDGKPIERLIINPKNIEHENLACSQRD